MTKKLNRTDLYVGIWCLYMMQGILYPVGVINQALQLLMLFWALVVACRTLGSRYNPSFMKATTALVLMYLVYGVFNILLNNNANSYVAPYVYLQSSLNSLLPIYLFYDFCKKGYMKEKHLLKYFFLFIVIYIFRYYADYNRLLSMASNNQTEFTNNTGYDFLLLFPLLFFMGKRPILQYVGLALAMLYIVLSMKRGAILIGALCFAIFIYHNFRSTETIKKKILAIIFTVVLAFAAVYLVQYMLDSSNYFISRIEQTKSGDTSGRDVIGDKIMAAVKNGTSLQILFGRGADSTTLIAGNFAHQDWLETLCNNGIIGFSILVIFFISFFLTVFKSRKIVKKNEYYAFLMLFLICFARTFVSMSVQNFDPCQIMLMGYLIYVSSSYYIPQR